MSKNRVTKTIDGEEYEAGDFLVVGDPEKTSTWSLPVSQMGEPDHTKMGAAHAALTEGFRGNKFEGTEEEKATALKKLKALYKKEDMEWPEDKRSVLDHLLNMIRGLFSASQEPVERSMSFNRLYSAVCLALYESKPNAWLIDLYSDGPVTFAVVSDAGKLYRVDVQQNGEDVMLSAPIQVTEEFPILTGNRSRVVVTREADGKYRWTLRAATAVLNRVGEIDSTELYDNFVKRVETEGYPVLAFWHEPGKLTIGQADFVARDGVVYLASGLFAENNVLADAVRADMESQPEYWGASIGYEPLKPAELIKVGGVEIPVYKDGINREISLVPEKLAANWFTAAYSQKEVTRMRKEIEDEIKRLLGDQAEIFIQSVDQTNREVTDGRMITRTEDQSGAAEQEQPAQEQMADATAVVQEVELDESFIQAVVAKLEELPKLSELAQAIADVKTEIGKIMSANEASWGEALVELREATDKRLQALEKTDEEKRREWVSNLPTDTRMRATYRPREAHAQDSNPDAPRDLAAIANQTLARLKK